MFSEHVLSTLITEYHINMFQRLHVARKLPLDHLPYKISKGYNIWWILDISVTNKIIVCHLNKRSISEMKLGIERKKILLMDKFCYFFVED